MIHQPAPRLSNETQQPRAMYNTGCSRGRGGLPTKLSINRSRVSCDQVSFGFKFLNITFQIHHISAEH